MSGSQSFGFGERYYHGLCPVTLKKASLPCSKCALVLYSSQEAAENHSTSHAPLCRLMVKLTKAAGGKSPLDRNPSACLQLAGIAKMCLRRSLTQFESDVLMYPRSCCFCASLLPSSGIVCSGCECTAFCGEDCREEDREHFKVCKQLKENKEDYMHWRENKMEQEVLSSTNFIITDPLDEVKEMSEALQLIAARTSLNDPLGRAISSVVSSPLTCKSALSFICRSSNSPLTVHLVGSRKIELCSLPAWSLLKSSKIKLVFIGPECAEPSDSKISNMNIECQYIPPCTYAQYADSSLFIEPDIICAFNCGFILYSSWIESIPYMVRKSGAPLVFTEYYMQDCKANLELVKDIIPVEVLVEPTLNAFRSFTSERAPVAMWGRDAEKLGRGRVVSDNAHVVVVKSRKVNKT